MPDNESAETTDESTDTSTEATTDTAETSPEDGSKDTAPDDAPIKKARQEAAKYRTRARDAEAEVSTLKADLQAARAQAEQVGALTSRAEQAEATALRYRVALEAGLPLTLAERLQGTDEDTIKADADSLRSLLGNSLNLDQGRQGTPPADSGPSINDALRALRGR